MPEMRQYLVTQVREVSVTANSPVDACRIAEAAFTNGQNSYNGVVDSPEGIWGNTTGRIREKEIYAQEKKMGEI